jgi:myo-inositol-1(or 4)-monophosphatase
VGDLFHFVSAYYAFRDTSGLSKAFLKTRRGDVSPIASSLEERLENALVTNFLMRPADRFPALAAQEQFLSEIARPGVDGVKRGRIGVDFGSVGLCHVAAGFTDAMVEIAKGFALWDFWPGQYILHAAGGQVFSLDGEPLHVDLRLNDSDSVNEAMSMRQKFVAAGSKSLALEILRFIH